MKLRDAWAGFLLGIVGSAVAAPLATNWINEVVTVRLPESVIARHPIDNGKYYLCWTDGRNRYGLAFRRTQLDSKIRSIPRAGRASVASLMLASPASGAPVIAPWTSSDAKICWPG